MDPASATALAGGSSAAAGLLGSVIGAVSAKKQQQRNINFQRETNAKNEALMRESWARDDTAVQRRAADLSAAGQSPLLASGAAASNSGPISTVSPRQDAPVVQPDMILNAINAGLGMVKTLSDMRNQKMQAESTVRVNDARQQNIDMDTVLKGEDVIKRTGKQVLPLYDNNGKKLGFTTNPIHDKGTDMTQVEKMAYDLWLSKKTGVRTTDPLHAHNLKRSTDAQASASTAMSRYFNKAADLMLLNTIMSGAQAITSIFTKLGAAGQSGKQMGKIGF